MPDYTVSADVDSMLRSANDAGIRSAIGVGTTDVPTFAGVTSTGVLSLPVGSAISTAIRFGTQGATTGLFSSNGATSPGIGLAISGTAYIYSGDSSRGLCLHSGWPLSWGSNQADSTPGLFLYRDGADGILAQRNGTAAQAFRVANSVGASPLVDYDRGVFDFKTTTNTLRIGTENGGTYTTARPIEFVTGGVVRMTIAAAGGLSVTGDVIASNTCRIGAGNGQVTFYAQASGILKMVDASFTNFNRINLGGDTNAFPAIKRNGTGIDIALADDSGLAGLSCALFNAAGIVNAAGSRILWAGRSAFSSPSDGVVRVTNNGSTGFTRLELGEADMGIMRGAGTPEGAVTAKVGSIFLRTDGGASTTLYVKESGTGNTGWVAK